MTKKIRITDQPLAAVFLIPDFNCKVTPFPDTRGQIQLEIEGDNIVEILNGINEGTLLISAGEYIRQFKALRSSVYLLRSLNSNSKERT